MKQNKPSLLLFFLLFTSLFFIVSGFTLTIIASPYIVSDLGGDRTITSYALSFFGFGTALSIPLARPLGARCGAHQIFTISLFLFGLTNLLCALAPTYFFFVLFRFCSGFASGLFYPLLARFFSEHVPPEQKLTIQSIFTTILVVVPVLGACWSGTVAYLAVWSLPFFVTGVIAFCLSASLFFAFKEIENPTYDTRIDWIGWCFYAIGIGSLTFALATAQQLDWYRSPLLVAATLFGAVSFGYYIVRSFNHPHPVLNLRLFQKPIFTLALLCLAVLFGIYFGMILLLAIWLKLDVQFTPVWIAILIGNMAIAGFFPTLIVKQKFGRIDPRIWLLAAVFLFGISCFYTTIFDQEVNLGRIILSRIIAGFGLALFLPPILQILSNCYSLSQWGEVFEIFQTVRNLGCGLGASIFSILWERRSVFYHERLNEQLSPTLPPVQAFLGQVEILHTPGYPLAQLNDFLNKSASSLALDDVFYLMGWILVALACILLITFFVKKEAFRQL